jgi:DNA-binding response OmpR family regulator
LAAGTPRKILVIDDDPAFGKIMKALAEARGIQCDWAPSLESLGRVGSFAGYDLAILDYFLEKLTGAEIAEYVDAFFANIPVVIVSSRPDIHAQRRQWPKCVRMCVDKATGARSILDLALQAFPKTA